MGADGLPEILKIGGVEYDVERVEDLHEVKPNGERQPLNGWILFDPGAIKVKAGLSLGRTRLVLIHEIIHGLLDHAGVDDLPHDEEERIIRALTPGLLMVLRDNPALVAFLTQDDRAPKVSQALAEALYGPNPSATQRQRCVSMPIVHEGDQVPTGELVRVPFEEPA